MTSQVPNTHWRRQALEDVQMERLRQLTKENWSATHDDLHEGRELARMATAYVMQYVHRAGLDPRNFEYTLDCGAGEYVPDGWEFKPKNPRRDLIRAAALILAEVERIDRASQTAKDSQHGA